jgi:serine/threonine protein kinase
MNPDKHQNALNQNDRLHWYEIKSILGQGGFGITYIARDTNLNHDVAIKEYLPVEFSTRNASGEVQPISEEHAETFEWGKSRFLEEARTLFQFKHENIVRVLSFFEANNTGYMVMEYEQGIDFSDLIGTGETFSEENLLEIIIPILDGLEQVHDQGFIHRDIKPPNIVLRNDGRPVLIDFGSARQAMGAQTRTLTALVTPGYSPLEQYHEAVGKQGPWTDIYALGATLYMAITGNKPADALKRSASRAEQKSDAYRRLSGHNSDLYTEHFLAAIDHALEFVAKNRPQSLGEWSKMLQGIEPVPNADPIANLHLGSAIMDEVNPVQDQPSPSPSQPDSVPPAVSRKRNPVVALLLIVIALLGGSAYFQWDSIQPLLSAAIEAATVNKQPAHKEELKVDTVPANDEMNEKPVTSHPVTLSKVDKPNNQASGVKQPEPTDSATQPKPSVTINLSGTYASELTYTKIKSGVDEHWYFGEPPNLKVNLQQVDNEIIGFIEGNRKGRLEGKLKGNEIDFVFNLVDPAGNTNQGKGTWFVAGDGKKMIGIWALVNVSDGSTFLEGNWKLTKIE